MRFDGVESVLHEVRNGEYRVANLRPFLEGPMFEPLKDPAFFQQVKVDPDARTVV